MKVRAKEVVLSKILPRIEPYTRQVFTTAGKEYAVHAIAVLGNGIPFFQFVNDLGYPEWKPAILFEISDVTLPIDWICNLFSSEDGVSNLLLGPDFIVKSAEAYDAMVKSEADEVDQFWKRVDSISSA